MKNKVKYKVIPFQQIDNSNLNDIGFIDQNGNFYYMRKYKQNSSQHTLVALDILDKLNAKIDNIYLACEELCRDYNYAMVIDDYDNNKVSIRYYNELSLNQQIVINKLYNDFVLFDESQEQLQGISLK